jgi:hypothetical protein
MERAAYTRIFAKSRNRVAGLAAANRRCFRVASAQGRQQLVPAAERISDHDEMKLMSGSRLDS